MEKKLVRFLLFSLLIPFLSYAQLGSIYGLENQNQSNNSSSVKQTPEKADGANAEIGGNRFYVRKHTHDVSKFYIHSIGNPGVSSMIRDAIPDDEQIDEGTFDENGNWWGINSNSTKILKINPSDGTIRHWFNPLTAGFARGIAYNTVDKQIYYLLLSGVNSILYKFNPVTDAVSLVCSYNGVSYWGLACSRDGSLYTLQDDSNVFPILKLSNLGVAFNTLVGPTKQAGIYSPAFYVELEFNHISEKLYLIGGNFLNASHTQIREVNLNTGATTLYHDFGNFDQERGLAFNWNLFLTGLEEGFVLRANSTYDIEWIGGGDFNVKLEFSSNNGATWNTIATDIPAGNGIYEWNVPNIEAHNCLLRITDLKNPDNTNTSPVFDIWKPFQFISGNGGENWMIGTEQTVSWITNLVPFGANNNGSTTDAANGMPDYTYVKLEFSLEGMNGPWFILGSNIKSHFNQVTTFSFNVPSFITNQGLFKLTYMGGLGEAEDGIQEANGIPNFIGYSDNFWSIYKNSTSGKMLITSPNGGEELNAGEYKYISWVKTSGAVSGTTFLEYSIDGGLSWIRINSAPIAGIMRYSWKVPNVNSNKCLVRMCNYLTKREIDRSDNFFTISNTGQQAVNYPNPFNPSTKIMFRLEKSEMTTLKIYNSIGQEVAMLVNKQLEAGSHSFEFNAANLPSGVYFYNLNHGGKSEIHKMMLLK